MGRSLFTDTQLKGDRGRVLMIAGCICEGIWMNVCLTICVCVCVCACRAQDGPVCASEAKEEELTGCGTHSPITLHTEALWTHAILCCPPHALVCLQREAFGAPPHSASIK